MSGIAGILHLDGSPLNRPSPNYSASDAQLLETLTDFQIFRGPDARLTWTAGPVGFGHTLLNTGESSPLSISRQRQPCSLDSEIWIVADARIDSQADLIAKLQSHGEGDLHDATDAELILRAYRVWGEGCVEHLFGDFAFAIWDGRKRKLFCARDQMGVKPFYYAHLGALFIFSNTLNCIRQHPAVSAKLNDLAIADFLLSDYNQDAATTTFADVQRLPPAYSLTCENQNVSTHRYWQLSVTTRVHYRRDQEYVEHFLDLLDAAVGDRLGGDGAGVLMSGGLDSPTVAASAQRTLLRRGKPNGLQAYTDVFDSLIPHDERHYAGLVAQHLNIPIHYKVDDHWRIFETAEEQCSGALPWQGSPEPHHYAWPDSTAPPMRQVAAGSRVALTGFGADPLLSCRITGHFRQLLTEKKLGRAVGDAIRYLSAEKRLSRLYLKTRWRVLTKPIDLAPPFPSWINPDFERNFSLRQREEQIKENQLKASAATIRNVRDEAVLFTTATLWPRLFETSDPGTTGLAAEMRHPFFDVRLMKFLLGLPPLPWCSDKQMLRSAAVNTLPDAVRLRRKSPLKANPLIALLQKPESAWVDSFTAGPSLERYVIRERIPAVSGVTDSWQSWINLRPLSLNYWLTRNESLLGNNATNSGHASTDPTA